MSATIGIAQVYVGKVRDWHNPRNEDCMHNASPAADCTCKRQVKRKPFRVVRCTDPDAQRQSHKIIVAELRMDNGLLTLRIKGKRKRVSTTLGALYARLVMADALNAARARKAARRGK